MKQSPSSVENFITLSKYTTGLILAYIGLDISTKIYNVIKKKRKIKYKENKETIESRKDLTSPVLKVGEVEQLLNERDNAHKMIKNKIKEDIKEKLRKISANNDIMNEIKNIEVNKHSSQIIKICFTGGPCAGKTTGLTHCSEILRDRGFKVYIVPEAATLIAQGGGMLNLAGYNEQEIMKFQSALMKTQMNLEDRFCELAIIEKGDKPAVVLCDRGVMDGSAYMDPASWKSLLDEMGLNTVQIRDRRYDAVIHLVTAADGAAEFYNLDNKARYENELHIAIDVDRRLQESWMGHPNWLLIDNIQEKGFMAKMRRLGEAVLHFVGVPSSVIFYKKYLIRNKQKPGMKQITVEIPESVRHERFEIVDTFLRPENASFVERRLRRRTQNDASSYYLVEVREKENSKVELKKRITAKEYIGLIEQRDQTRLSIKKIRQCLMSGPEYFVFETFLVSDPFSLVIVQAERDTKEIAFPDFLEAAIVREVTDEDNYQPRFISRKDWRMSDKDRELLSGVKDDARPEKRESSPNTNNPPRINKIMSIERSIETAMNNKLSLSNAVKLASASTQSENSPEFKPIVKPSEIAALN